ncbi:hypothetical protein [Stenotrophomonas maltophilia]|uniref:hypothetical protein n=1 Tax=Stenotrophomonas maltophilia TaxID=40324 RepID=UPI003BF83BBA
MSDNKAKSQFSFVFKDEPKSKIATISVLKDKKASEHVASVHRRLLESGVFSVSTHIKRSR